MSQDLIVHEAAHQWFGNAITVKPWDDLWIHEGFPTYAQKLWLEQVDGIEAYNEKMKNVINGQLRRSNELPAAFDLPALPLGEFFPADDPGVLYNFITSYAGGALLLHNLRLEVGDETFFTIVRTFVERFKDVPVTSEDFVAVAEEVADRDLTERLGR